MSDELLDDILDGLAQLSDDVGAEILGRYDDGLVDVLLQRVRERKAASSPAAANLAYAEAAMRKVHEWWKDSERAAMYVKFCREVEGLDDWRST